MTRINIFNSRIKRNNPGNPGNVTEKNTNPGPNEIPKSNRLMGGTALAIGALAIFLTYQSQTKPEEGNGREVYNEKYIKEPIQSGDSTLWNHSKAEEEQKIQESLDWALEQVKNNGYKLGKGNFGNAMFNYLHDKQYQKCEEQNAQVGHLMSMYLNQLGYNLQHFKIGLAYDSKWIIEDTLPLKKHLWIVIIPQDALKEPMAEDSRNQTHAIVDPWAGHKELMNPMEYKGFGGFKWIPESIEILNGEASSHYWGS